MRIGATITLNIGVNTAREGLAELADTSWLISLPRQDPRCGQPGGHPAGRGRPAAGGGAGTIAVTFGQLAVPAEADALLTVRWESAEPGDQFTVLLDADIILGPAAGQASSVLTLAGSCRLPPVTLITEGYELARAQVIEAAREFITSIADAVTRSGAQGPEPRTRGEAQSWVTGIPRQQLPGGIRAEGRQAALDRRVRRRRGPASSRTRRLSSLLAGSMILASTRWRNTSSLPATSSSPRTR